VIGSSRRRGRSRPRRRSGRSVTVDVVGSRSSISLEAFDRRALAHPRSTAAEARRCLAWRALAKEIAPSPNEPRSGERDYELAAGARTLAISSMSLARARSVRLGERMDRERVG